MKNNERILRAKNAAPQPEPTAGPLFFASCQATLECAEGGEGKGLAKFKMTAYTGGAMMVSFWRNPVVVDLTGMRVPNAKVPVRMNHDPDQGVGHSTSISVSEGKVIADGVISRDTTQAREIVTASKNGFPWQVSIGASVERMEFVEAGSSVTVNGQTFKGPINVARASTLGELSIVDWGADMATSASIAARNKPDKEVTNMAKDANGNEIQESATPAPAAAPIQGSAPAAPGSIAAIREGATQLAQADLEAHKRAITSELERVSGIQKICASQPDIAIKAIKENWTPQQAELEVVRASRPAVNPARSEHQANGNRILEAAACVACGLPGVEKAFDERTLNAAHLKFKRNVSLSEIILEAAQVNGDYHGRARDIREMLRAAFTPNPGIQAAGFSTVDIGGILSNVANKFLLAGFSGVEQAWRKISSIRPVNDFKQISSYRLLLDGSYSKVGPGGELKHGRLADETFTNKAATYGMMLAITREHIINDDLGAISQVPRMLGRAAGLKFNEVFWLEFLDNTAFFTSGNVNLLTGLPLSLTNLGTAEAAFLAMVDSTGKPTGTMPKSLVVPSALKSLAETIFSSRELRDTTASTKAGTTNIFAGRYEPVSSAYLGATGMTGYSATSWYLAADPNDNPVMETAFLDGNEAPTVETADADFNTLGIQMRGYHDFGCKKQDPKAAIRANA